MSKVLVTGSGGSLGTALMWTLPASGYSPIGLDIVPSETTTYVGSFGDAELVCRIFAENNISHIVHAGTLHKPHIETHSKQEFVDTNISGTLALLEQAAKSGKCRAFIFTSTTSLYGSAFSAKPGEPATWIDENVVPAPKNIYGVTKVAAENLCGLVHRQTGLPILILRVSRFFTGLDGPAEGWTESKDNNLKVNELAYRRVDIADVVSAHICALEKASEIKWGTYVISAPTPFTRDKETLRLLDGDAPTALQMVVPDYRRSFDKLGWSFLPRLDRVYDSAKARKELGWKPLYTFHTALKAIDNGMDWRSELAILISNRVVRPSKDCASKG
ncbi:hypothetical protein HDU86_006965 [Geranomyces michiganensis]|nr:hypothetical protein HDU86_006965 [Geranomyces michiganensis]